MGLINLKTDFKSLRFGQDRFDGGSSNQPYIKSSIPEGSSTLNSLDNDFIWRNGIKTFADTGKDLVRIGKFFIDFKTPSGVLFIAKQNLLSRTGVKTQASGLLNDGAYLPTNTLAQVGVSAFGLHFNKQGLLPLGLTTYSDVVTYNQPSGDNRLVQLSGSTQNEPVNILTYGGGPGSVLGVGDTTIKFADQRTGYNNPLYINDPLKFFGRDSKQVDLVNVNRLLGASVNAGIKSKGVNYETNTVDLYFGFNTLSNSNLITSKFAKENSLGQINLSVTDNSFYVSKNIKYSNRIYGTEGFNGDVYAIIPSSSYSDKQGVSYAYSQYVPTSASVIKESNAEFNNFTPDLYQYGTLEPDPAQITSKAGWISKNYEPGYYLTHLETYPSGASTQYSTYTKQTLEQRYFKNGHENSPGNVYDTTLPGNTWPDNTYVINNQGNYTFTQQDIIDQDLNDTNPVGPIYRPIRTDFRAQLRNKSRNGEKQPLAVNTAENMGNLTKAPDYSGFFALDRRVHQGDPGNRSNKNYADYSLGVRREPISGTNLSGSRVGPLDKINALPIYQSSKAKTSDFTNDLVKFRIAAINNDSPSQKRYIHFRAYLDAISDNYQANWSDIQYLGRGEKFYNYTGFGRTISLGWTVAAQSREELMPMYKKLNYLASLLAPDYSSQGYMRGNIVQLTVGGYLYEQPGIITSLTYNMDENTTWEIGINSKGGSDPEMKELAHVIKVSGFSFTPIHRFVPRTQTLGFAPSSSFANFYGNQRYIALSNGSNNNYDDNLISYKIGTGTRVKVF